LHPEYNTLDGYNTNDLQQEQYFLDLKKGLEIITSEESLAEELLNVDKFNAFFKVEVTDLVTKITVAYDTLGAAALALGEGPEFLLRLNRMDILKGISTPLRERYSIAIRRGLIT